MQLKIGRKYKRTSQGNMPDYEWSLNEGTTVTINKIIGGYVHFTPSIWGFTRYTEDYFSRIFTKATMKNIIGGEILTDDNKQGEKQC